MVLDATKLTVLMVIFFSLSISLFSVSAEHSSPGELDARNLTLQLFLKLSVYPTQIDG